MRILLFTGKGGVGKSTVAAGTAALAARRGARVLALSTDTAHSLADAYDVELGAEPTQVADGLWVHQVDTQQRFEESWAEIQDYLTSVLAAGGLDPVSAEELSVIPGAEEVLALLELRRHARTGEWDLIVVDCAPTAETLRLLALPEALGWYMKRVLPVERRVVKALRPVLDRATGVPMPTDAVFDAIERLNQHLLEVRELLTRPESSVRIVLTPERVVLAEARRSRTSLALFGYRVDGVVANRIFPADAAADPWRQGWVDAQRAVLEEVEESFALVRRWRAEYQPGEPRGHQALAALAEVLYAGDDPLEVSETPDPQRWERGEDHALLRLRLEGAEQGQIELARRGEELVVTVGSYRRVVAMPAGLARFSVAGARIRDEELQVRFQQEEQ